MPEPRRSLPYLIGLLLVSVLAVFLWTNRDEGGQAPSGRSGEGTAPNIAADDALAALQDLELRMVSTPLPVMVGDRSFNLIPTSVGFDLDERATLAGALESGEPAWVVEAAARWNQDPPGPALPLVGRIDAAALSNVLDRLDTTLEGPFDGGIRIEGAAPIARYPRSGWTIDRSEAESRVISALLAQPRPDSIGFDLLEQQPALSAAAVDTALAEAKVILGSPITLSRTDPALTLYLTTDDLARALTTKVEREPDPRISVTLDPLVINEFLHPLRTRFESVPVDARIEIDDEENIRIVPGFAGALIDTDLVIEAIMDAAGRPSRATVLPLQAGIPPTVTAELLRDLGVDSKISEFTTYHPCCRPRVKNIQLFADEIDGTLILPGEVLSLNEAVGKRTSERGFVPAPTIIRGEIKDTVGGGVSQFATTFYNAVFWAGLEIIDHQPHSYYFPRYPEGIEATINWTEPDLIFRNDTDYGVVIQTSHTGTSITVKLFGNVSDRKVRAAVSERYDPKEYETEYLPNPEIMPWDEENEVQEGFNGWSVKVTRVVDFADGSTTRRNWTVNYHTRPRQVEVHPCLLPEDSEHYTGEGCPTEPGTEPEVPPSTIAPAEEPPEEEEAPEPTTTVADSR